MIGIDENDGVNVRRYKILVMELEAGRQISMSDLQWMMRQTSAAVVSVTEYIRKLNDSLERIAHAHGSSKKAHSEGS